MSLPEEIGKALRKKGWTLSTAESCTGGSLAACITAVPGSSDYYKGSVVAYANEVKCALLGVNVETVQQHGAVSRETVVEMVRGAQRLLHTDCAVATSGIAGPGGGTPDKPVGTIWIAVACGEQIVTFRQSGDYGRTENVARTVTQALRMLLEKLQ
ncbi:MAG: CinA family protein [Mediterranea sp.]|jgi:PncC family amidohydrolase|nr:CinA family protein [Mediterranea sp.]